MRIIRCVAGAMALGVLVAGSVRAQGVSFPVGLHVGVPQGDFAENVKVAGGLGGGAIWGIGPILGLRAGFDFMVYGSERRRVPLGGGALGLIKVDVTTTNAIFGGNIGAQLGTPGPTIRPYLGGMIGFSSFSTTSSVSGSNSADESFASSNNSSDNAFSKIALAGIYIPAGRGSTMIELGARYTWNGKEVSYLTPGDITEDGITGDIILTPRRTRADLLTVVLGVTIRPGRPGLP